MKYQISNIASNLPRIEKGTLVFPPRLIVFAYHLIPNALFMSSEERVSREANVAMDKLREHWPPRLPIESTLELTESDIQNDLVAFCQQPIVLHRGGNWRWNRATVLNDLSLDDDTKVTLQKMQSRSTIKHTKGPSFKVWLYAIRSTVSPVYFLWIERGWELPPVEQLSFLSSFVAESLARELNWIP